MKLIGVIVLLLSGCVSIQTHKNVETAGNWGVVQTGNEKLPVSYVYDKCIVMPAANGKGLTVVATDPGWHEGHLTQLILINQNGVKLDLRRKKSGGKTEATTGYDIFGTKCANAAKSLPQEVISLFFGHYVNFEHYIN